MPPAGIIVTIDASRPESVAEIVTAWLRPMLFHEIHHLARWAATGAPQTLVDHAISEGRATVFERDFAKSPTPWGEYPADVRSWADELTLLPPDAPVRDWIYAHPDGRRWIGMKVGAYWVDEATRRSGRSAVDLIDTPTTEILALAQNLPR